MKNIASFLLGMSYCFIHVSLAQEPYSAHNIVRGTVVRIDKSGAPPWDAWVSITQIYGTVKAGVEVGDEFRMRTGNFSGPNGEPPPGNDFSLVSPELTVGETGIWAMAVDNYGNKHGDQTGMYGRAWPSIKGRDPSFAAVELWAQELDGDAARQEDYYGEKWPSPNSGYISYEPSPTSDNHTQTTPTPKQSPVVQPPSPKQAPDTKTTVPRPSEKPILSTPWSIIVVVIVAVLGLLWVLLKKRK
jgi:hypothetical protein